MKKLLSLILVIVVAVSCFVCPTFAEDKPTLYIIGDGIAATAGEDMYPSQGWGEYFKGTLRDIHAVNAAVSGKNMTAYITDGHWKNVSSNLKRGDFVLVAFGAESQDARGKAQYSKALIKYAFDTFRAGSEIIFVTPAATSGTLKQNNALNPMTQSIKNVGKMLSVPVIDLNAEMRKAYISSEGKETEEKLKTLYNALYISNTQNAYYRQRGTVSEFAQKEASAKSGVYLTQQGAKYAANIVARLIKQSDAKLKAYTKNVDDATERTVYYDVLNEMSTGEVRGILYDGMDYEGLPTQVFAYLGIPEGVTKENPAPAMVLVHGGGGKAYLDWVEKWVEKGYVAISYYFMESKASNDNKLPSENVIHYYGGPRRGGGIDDVTYSTIPQSSQWMYHATADASLAYNLLNSLPEVKKGEIGISGISWGGVVTASVIGRDTRFRLAMPVYGGGYLDENLANIRPVSKWDGRHNFDKVKQSGMKTLFINSPSDYYFDVTTTTKSAASCGGDALILHMFGHGEPDGSGVKGTLDEVFVFADSVFKGGDALPVLSAPKKSGTKVTFTADSKAGIKSAALYYNTGGILYDSQCQIVWLTKSAEVSGNKITATLPSGTKGYYIQVTDNNGYRMTTGYQSN